MSSSPSATGGPPPKSNLLRIDQLHVGGFYDFQFVADDELSPDAPEHLREEYKYVYGTSRLGLVVAVMPSYVRVLVYTLCPPGGVAANGDQHRWIPFSPTNRFAHQPEIHVETAPSELAVPESDKLYLCFTHVVQISKCRGGSAADETGGETAGATDEHFQTCTNLGAIRQAHADYWAGARYDENGAKYGGCQAGPSNQVKTWYDERQYTRLRSCTTF